MNTRKKKASPETSATRAGRPRTTREILASVQDTLVCAEHGLTDFRTGHATRRLSGLRNLVIWGRAVTNVLQNLRSTEGRFDEWYDPYRREMEADALMKYFYTLRSELLKEGALNLSREVHIHTLDIPGDFQRIGPPPPGAKGIFVGDEVGGSGWYIELPDGSIEKYYVRLPATNVSVTFRFPEPPTHHRGQPLSDTSVEALSLLYIEYLGRLVREAEATFRPG